VALAAVAGAFAARLILEPILGEVAPLLLFSLAVVVASWYGGLGPGLVATLAGVFIGDFFFIEPLYTFHIAGRTLARQTELGLFIVTGTLVSVLNQQRITSEEKRQQLLIRERDAREAAEAANQHKDVFIAMVSHELRSPLNAILGWAVLLCGGQLDQAEMNQAAKTIERNARVQMRLIDDLLDVSRIMSGKLHLVPEPVKLGPVVEAAADVIRPTAEAKGVQLCVALSPTADQVMGDQTRLQQVVWNLLSNAVKFTPSGGRVDVSLDRLESMAQITVHDTGKGISPQFLPHVFDRFSQADGKSGGLGLGLAITKSLVTLHGGAIEASSDGEGLGTTFKVFVPLLGKGNNPRVELDCHEPAELASQNIA
jgi:signal transduction histidine kinase